jgi:hypothetical protein
MAKEKGESFSKVRYSKPRAAGDENDTEGHSRSRARGAEGESFSKTRVSRVKGAADEDDTEGHVFRPSSPSSRGE